MFSISKKWFISKSFYSKKVAVLIDLKEGKLNSSSLNLFSAAQKLSSNFSVFISTSDPKMELDAKEQLLKVNNFPKGVNEIFVNCDEGTAENITENISSIFVNEKFTHLLTIHDSFGKNCLPRIASKISESKKTNGQLKYYFILMIFSFRCSCYRCSFNRKYFRG